jgi:calpain-15
MGDIYTLFDTKERKAAGIYSIRLWNMGLPVSVVVDDYFPFKQDNTPAFSKFSPSKELWPMLLEKAIAKAIANYDFAAVGTPNDAMFILTGAPGNFFANSTKKDVQIFD